MAALESSTPRRIPRRTPMWMAVIATTSGNDAVPHSSRLARVLDPLAQPDRGLGTPLHLGRLIALPSEPRKHRRHYQHVEHCRGQEPARITWAMGPGFDGLARLPPAPFSREQARHGRCGADRHSRCGCLRGGRAHSAGMGGPRRQPLCPPGAAAKYEYDFGDGWEHEMTLEAIVPRQKGIR